MRVALVHDWITGMRGGERCLAEFLSMYPDADIYTLVHEPGVTTPEIDRRVRGTSWLQRFPRLRKRYRLFLPLFPLLARSIKVQDYDLVISLSHAIAKNASYKNVGCHVCFCFTPMRYIWDMAPFYLGRTISILCAPFIALLREWDRRGASQVDHFVGISRFIAARIRKFYSRKADVLYPPVMNKWETSVPMQDLKQRPFLYAGAFVPYKGVEHIIEAFNELQLPLWCVGSGPLEEELKRKAGDNVSFLGAVTDCELGELYQKARALIFPAKEDFGIIPIEALLSGTPVIAGYHGATRETIPGWRWWLGEAWNSAVHAGVFFPIREHGQRLEESEYPRLLVSALRQFISIEGECKAETAIHHGRKFSLTAFQQGWIELLKKKGIAAPEAFEQCDEEQAMTRADSTSDVQQIEAPIRKVLNRC